MPAYLSSTVDKVDTMLDQRAMYIGAARHPTDALGLCETRIPTEFIIQMWKGCNRKVNNAKNKLKNPKTLIYVSSGNN